MIVSWKLWHPLISSIAQKNWPCDQLCRRQPSILSIRRVGEEASCAHRSGLEGAAIESAVVHRWPEGEIKLGLTTWGDVALNARYACPSTQIQQALHSTWMSGVEFRNIPQEVLIHYSKLSSGPRLFAETRVALLPPDSCCKGKSFVLLDNCFADSNILGNYPAWQQILISWSSKSISFAKEGLLRRNTRSLAFWQKPKIIIISMPIRKSNYLVACRAFVNTNKCNLGLNAPWAWPNIFAFFFSDLAWTACSFRSNSLCNPASLLDVSWGYCCREGMYIHE